MGKDRQWQREAEEAVKAAGSPAAEGRAVVAAAVKAAAVAVGPLAAAAETVRLFTR